MPSSVVPSVFMGYGGWNISTLPEPFSSWPQTSTRQDAISAFNTSSHRESRLHYFIMRALLSIVNGDQTIIKRSDSSFCSEWMHKNGEVSLFVYNSNGDIMGSKVTAAGAYIPIETIGGKNDSVHTGGIFLAMMGLLKGVSHELGQDLEIFFDLAASKSPVPDDLYYRICNGFYYGIKTGAIPLNIPKDGNINLLLKKNVETIGAFVGETVMGESHFFNSKIAVKSNGGFTHFIDVSPEFESFANERSLSDEEEALIPKIPDDYLVPSEVIDLARDFIGSRNDASPQVNFMLRGATSTGKSTGVKILAALLHRPLLKMVCHPKMETWDFLSSFVPNTDNLNSLDLPSYDDIGADPEGSYEKVTGVYKEGITPEEVLEALEGIKEDKEKFKHVVSPYIKALQNGYILEIQEASRIKNPGTLVGLNEYWEPGNLIPLLDGSFVKRHKDAIVIVTDNVGYVSNNSIDQSVIRRFDQVYDFEDLSKDKALDRVTLNTKFEKKDLLSIMYDTWEKVKKYCDSNSISEGSCSVTELEKWAQCVKNSGYAEIKKYFKRCVVSKATSELDEQSAILAFGEFLPEC